jgi:hypothetical protein
METTMRLLPVIALSALAAAPSASAEQERQHSAKPPAVSSEPGQSLTVGQGVICNTKEQAKRLVSLQNDGRAITEALGTVNREAQDPTACGPAQVLFRVAEQVDGDQLNGQSVKVVKIVIHAIMTGDQWSQVPDVEQYAILPPPGIAI